MRANFLIRYKLHHLLIWTVLFGIWYYFRFQDYPSRPIAITTTLLKVADLALMVYLTNYLLIPQLLYKREYFLFTFLFLALVFGGSIGKMWIEGQIMHDPAQFSLFNSHFKARFYDNVIPHYLLVATGASIKLLLDYARAQRRLGEMAKEKAEAELNFLKSQINPHFLFNSLNSVYFLIDKNNSEARGALHTFSGMLRYQLYECNGEEIPVEKEIAYLKNFVDLQKLRREAPDDIRFEYTASVKDFSIPPFLLIPFVENAFKHLSHFSGAKKNEVVIEADRHNGKFIFTVVNSTEHIKRQENAGGIGLKNVRRRLELLYPERHVLNIYEQDQRFSVRLELDLNKTR
jgi:two-component system LytT family sensor kinase